VANGLLAQGLVPGDRVALMLPSHPDHVVAILALARSGWSGCRSTSHLVGAALEHTFDQFEPRRADRPPPNTSRSIAPVLASRNVEKVIWRGARASAYDRFAALLAHARQSPAGRSPRRRTTSSRSRPAPARPGPKGVLKSDRTLRAGPMGTLRLTGAEPATSSCCGNRCITARACAC
jgi:crotonobetaine/carnitine-CoA ligase